MKKLLCVIPFVFCASAFADVQGDNWSSGAVQMPHPQQAAQQAQPLTVQQRLTRLENQMANLIQANSASKQQQTQQQLQQLNGQIQMQSHTIQVMRQQLRTFYQDLNQRLTQLQSGVGKKTVSAQTLTPVTSQAQTAYSAAFDLLRKKQYNDAASAFSTFINNYPKNQYVVNAHYWLGEIYYLQGSQQKAAGQFQTVVAQFPKSKKVPDALLKIAFITAESGKTQQAAQQLRQLMQQYPNSTAAQLAHIRLQTLQPVI